MEINLKFIERSICINCRIQTYRTLRVTIVAEGMKNSTFGFMTGAQIPNMIKITHHTALIKGILLLGPEVVLTLI